MLEQLFQMIETAAMSPHAAIIISLAMNVTLAWGWWRREQGHNMRYDTHVSDWMNREKVFLESLDQRDEELAAVGREAFTALRDVASALAGMERTLDGLETLLTMTINQRLRGGNKNES